MASTTPISTIQGLASGIKWQDMIDQIMQANSTPITNLNSQITAAQSREAAWVSYRSAIQALNDAASGLADASGLSGLTTSVTGLTSGAAVPFTAAAGSTATPGDYQVSVLRLAAAEKLGGASYASSANALQLSGQFLINGQAFQVTSSDSLASIASRINAANTGSNPLGVSAGVAASTTGGYRLVLTSARTGAAGISLADGTEGILQQLGLVDSSETARHPLSNGLQSDGFADETTAVGTLLKLSSPPLRAQVTIGNVPITIDLSTESLDDIVADYNGKAGRQAMTVVTDAGGRKSIQYTGSAAFVDDQNALQLLGFTQAGRSSVQQVLQGGALVDRTTGLAATPQTTFAQLGANVVDAQHPESITVTGTRGDGSAVSFAYNITDGTQTLQDFVNALTGALGGPGRTANATLQSNGDGSLHLQVTDGASGDSMLSLTVVANNEHGGTVDFGALTATQVGQTRRITAGSDALIQVDGTPIQRTSNTIADAISGVTLNLTGTSSSPVGLSIARDNSASVKAIKAFVTAYNGVADFVAQQTTPPAAGQAAPPLFSDALLRSIRTTLQLDVQKVLGAGVAGSWTRLGDVGITIDKTSHFQLDESVLSAAVAADPGAIQRLFGLSGTGATGDLSYLGASDATADGTYSVQVTTAGDVAHAAGAASAVGTGTMSVTDLGTGKSYAVSLTNGENATDMAAALNAEFARSTARVLTGTSALTDAGNAGAAVTDATTWADARDGSGSIAADGDQLTVSGTRSDGTSFKFFYDVGAGHTLGELRSQIQGQFGSDADVTWDSSGRLAVTAQRSGLSLLSLAVTSNGSTLAPFGSLNVTTDGRGPASLKADDAGGILSLASLDYGSAAGFTVSYAGTDAGVTTTAQHGVDVVGTIDGAPATGSGRVLTGASGTGADGLMLTYTGTGAGAGSITFSRGVASSVLLNAATFLGSGDGSIDAITQGIDTAIAHDQDRIATIQERLDNQRQRLTAQFLGMEQAVARAQSQMQWLTGQLNSLGGYGNNSSHS